MPKEIERKFLVLDSSFVEKAFETHEIVQAYITTDKEAVIRVRISDEKAFITIKGANKGIVRDEWEYNIPYDDANEMIERLPIKGIIRKTRYKVCADDGLTWEIDCFHGKHEGLILAEVELPDESVKFNIPPFIGEEVTNDPQYYNAVLSQI